jgi:subfamily B ATP-binding cassette protein MsbA
MTHHQLLKTYLWSHTPILAFATICSVLLGGVSATIGTLVGPAVHVLGAPPTELVSVVELFGPYLGPVFASILGDEQITAQMLLSRIPLALITLGVFKAMVSLSGWYIWERTGEMASRDMRRDLVKSYLASNPFTRKTDQAREMESRLSSGVATDIKLMREYVVHFYGGLPRELSQVIFLVVVVFLLSPKLAGIFFLAVLPAGALASNLGRKLRRRASKALEDYSLLTEWLQQRLLGVETIKHYGTEELEVGKMRELTTRLFDKFMHAVRVKARTSPTLEFVSVLFFMVVLGVALFDIYSGRSTGSVQLSFFASLAFLMQSAGKIGRYYNTNREGAAAVDRINAMIDFYGSQNTPNIEVSRTAGVPSLKLEGVTVQYPGQEDKAVHDFSYEFSGGKVYCLSGPSGAGKTTVMSLILGLVKSESGTISCQSQTLHPIVYMPQKVQLAPTTVSHNVSYPEEPDPRRVEEALRKSGAWKFVQKLEQGVHTIIGEEGRVVSGGQAQRILLARLWYHPGELVMIDEGTSALDPEMEQLIYGLQSELAKQGRIVITIAHRPGAAAAADEVVSMEAGRLISPL